MSIPNQPETRTEMYLNRMATGAGTIPTTPINRKENYYVGIIEHLDTKADLVNGKVPASQLPSYLDDVEEYASFDDFPTTGERGKIYIALDTNKTYRWGGSVYVQVGSSLTWEEVV